MTAMQISQPCTDIKKIYVIWLSTLEPYMHGYTYNRSMSPPQKKLPELPHSSPLTKKDIIQINLDYPVHEMLKISVVHVHVYVSTTQF